MFIEPNLLLIGLQAVPFLVTLVALYVIIFRPMLDYLDEREEAMTRGRAEAAEMHTQIERQLDEYNSKMADARREIAELRKQRRAQAVDEYAARVAGARAESEDRVTAAITDIQSEFRSASAQLAATAEALANDIAGQVLGRALNPSPPPAGDIQG